MIEAFRQGMDIHSATAARVFGVALAEVNRDMRSKAKAVNFGIAYGQTAFGLSQNLGISRTEAKEIIDNYNEKFPGVARLMEENIEFARKHGYVKTVLGRKRYLRDINSANNTVRSAAEKSSGQLSHTGKCGRPHKSCYAAPARCDEQKAHAQQNDLQVHDELVFDAHRDEVEEPVLVREKMVNALSPTCPLKQR